MYFKKFYLRIFCPHCSRVREDQKKKKKTWFFSKENIINRCRCITINYIIRRRRVSFVSLDDKYN